jgi:ABC-type lipoprotein export system ATPase subunit
MVTHEEDIAQTSKKKVVFKDGKMLKSDGISVRTIASEQLLLLPQLEEVEL